MKRRRVILVVIAFILVVDLIVAVVLHRRTRAPEPEIQKFYNKPPK